MTYTGSYQTQESLLLSVYQVVLLNIDIPISTVITIVDENEHPKKITREYEQRYATITFF